MSLVDVDLNILYTLITKQNNESSLECHLKQCSSALSGDPYEVACGYEVHSTIREHTEEMRSVARRAKFRPNELHETCRQLANVRCACRASKGLPISQLITEFKEPEGANWVFVW